MKVKANHKVSHFLCRVFVQHIQIFDSWKIKVTHVSFVCVRKAGDRQLRTERRSRARSHGDVVDVVFAAHHLQ